MSTLPHESAELLLPWYVAGTLSDPERAAVADHLRACEACRREEAWLRGVAGAVRARPLPLPAPELAARTLARIAAREAGGPWWRRLWAVREARAVVALAVVQAAAIAFLLSPKPHQLPFRVLGRPAPAHLQVVFRPQLTEAELRAVLQRLGATVVDGPGAAGVYRLRLPQGSDPRLVADRLRREGVAQFAEPEP